MSKETATRELILGFLLAWAGLLVSPVLADPDLDAVLALGSLTNVPTIYPAAGYTPSNGVSAIYYDGLDYTGKATRVFAWIGIPTNAPTPMPAVVLVHGGGGTAFRNWVELWNARGYAAISMDVEGRSTDPVTEIRDIHEWGGPQRVGIYGDSAQAITNQWMYHAVADTVLANSLLRAQPGIDTNKVGMVGISWGGVIVSTVMGLDDRFAFSIPIYGCGRLFDLGNHYGNALGNNDFYKTIWDPMLRMDQATMPAQWFSWPQENNFSLDSQAATYYAGAGPRMVTLIPGMGHGHGAAWNRQDSYAFADSIVSNAMPWCMQQSLQLSNNLATVTFNSSRSLDQAKLITTTGTGYTGSLTWNETSAALADNGGGNYTVTATLPADTTGWFVNVLDGVLVASSDYQENISLALSPTNELYMIHHPIFSASSTASVEVVWTAPTNVEVVDIRVDDESHPGAFSSPELLPLIWDDPSQTTQSVFVVFSNSVAGLTQSQSATGTLVIAWETVDLTTNEVHLALHATAGAATTVVYDVTANWTSQIVRAIDQVIIQDDAEVTLEDPASATGLTLNDGHFLSQGNLQLSQSLSIDSGGVVHVSEGMLILDGESFTIDGLLILDGGTFEAEGLPDSGSGGLIIRSGTMNVSTDVRTDIDLIEISGGVVNFGDEQVMIGKNDASELRVLGSDAAITMKFLNQQPWGGKLGTFHFVFDASGISKIGVTSWMHLTEAQVQVDGANYIGGAGAHILVDAVNFATVGDTNKFVATNFERHGLIPSFEQDQTDGKDWLRLILTAHSAITITYVTNANWSSMEVFGNDSVVVSEGATVTVDTPVWAGAVQIDGTLLFNDGAVDSGKVDSVMIGSNGLLRFDLDLLGVTPVVLTGTVAVASGGRIEVNGTDYEALDGYFPLILSSNLPAGITNQVSLIGLGERHASLVLQGDGLWLRLTAPLGLSERLCTLVPASTVEGVYSNTSFSASRAFVPTGSSWGPSLNEAHVMDTRLTQDVLFGSGATNQSWDIRVGRGGQIASMRTPALGETVPPSWNRKDIDGSPWVDEVWQGVSVDTGLNDSAGGSPYFIHQAGVYPPRDRSLAKPFYAPQVASHLNVSDRSFTTINWGQHAHIGIYTNLINSDDWQSQLLYFTRLRDLGHGVIEVSLGFYNYGTDLPRHFNMPWGGVRRTSMEYAFFTQPGGGWSNALTPNFGDGVSSNYLATAGAMAFSATSNGSSPALGLVFGFDPSPLLPHQYSSSLMRYGYAGGSFQPGENDWRNYYVISAIRKYYLSQGRGVWARYFFVLGDDLTDVESRITERNIVDGATLSPFDYSESSAPLVAYSYSGSGTNFQITENSDTPNFFLYAHPVTNSYPIYEIIENDSTRHITWDPYATGVIKTYDGTIAGVRLLGFALQAADLNAQGTAYVYEPLTNLFAGAAENYLSSGKELYARIATPIETWRVAHFGFADNAGAGADLSDPEGDGLQNLLEYALGGIPTEDSDASLHPHAQIMSPNGFPVVEYIYRRQRNASAQGLNYSVQVNEDLLAPSWNTNGVQEVGSGIIDSQFESVTNRVNTIGKEHGTIRLKISR